MGVLGIHAAPGAKITVERIRHDFCFGATLPGDMEPERGKVNYATVDAMLAWADQEGTPIRQRARGIAADYRGQFAGYDLNNEMIHANWFEERFGPTLRKQMARWVKEGDPGAKLFTNDYDMIGVQGHLHGDSLDVDALRHALDTLAQFKLPIRITEFNFPGQRSKYDNQRDAKLTPEEEQAKALALRQFYRVAFAHPAVAGIMMWGFREGANWIPVSLLYRRDWTPTPAAEACRDLVFRQWWTQWSGTADASGAREFLHSAGHTWSRSTAVERKGN